MRRSLPKNGGDASHADPMRIVDIEEGTQPGPTPPAVGDMVVAATNLAFAIELYIKAILVVSQIEVPRGRNGHDLEKLYERLPNHFKVLIEHFYDGTRRRDPWRRSITFALGGPEEPEWDDLREPQDLNALLTRSSDLFSSWRYIHEFTIPNKDGYQFRRFEYSGLLAGCRAMRDAVNTSRS
jgi:hypothetical protein